MNPDITDRPNPEKCAQVVLAALWMTGYWSSWATTSESYPCENAFDPDTLARLHANGLIQEPPLIDYRPICLTPEGERLAQRAFRTLCCD